MDLNWLFDNCRRYAFRLEALPSYESDTHKKDYREFLRTGQLPVDHNLAWRQEVRDAAVRGVQYKRLRLFSDKLSDYERYERDSFRASIEAGERVRAVRRSVYPASGDFWWFDGQFIAEMNYDERGNFLSAVCREANQSDAHRAQYWLDVWETHGEDPLAFT